MKLGIPTLLELDNLEKQLRFCSENGYDFFEMSFMFPWYQTDNIDISEFKAKGREYKVQYTLHLPDDFNPFCFCPEMREGMYKSSSFAFKMAKELGVLRITMHMLNGSYSSVKGEKKYLYDNCGSIYMDHVERFADFAQKNLEGTDTFLCIENTKGFLPFQKKAIECMLTRPSFGLTFDVGHSYKAGGDDEKYMFMMKDRIRHFHIHDVTGKGNHFGLGEGILDIERWLKTAEESSQTALIEVKGLSSLEVSTAYLKERGYLK